MVKKNQPNNPLKSDTYFTPEVIEKLREARRIIRKVSPIMYGRKKGGILIIDEYTPEQLEALKKEKPKKGEGSTIYEVYTTVLEDGSLLIDGVCKLPRSVRI